MKKVSVAKTVTVRIRRPVVHFIKEWRKHRGLSLDTLGTEAGISPSMISQLENGKTTYTQSTLEKLAKVLEVEPWQLLAYNPQVTADLWRIIIDMMDEPDMKIALRHLAQRRAQPPASSEDGTTPGF